MTCLPCQLQKLFSGMLPANRSELIDYIISTDEPVSDDVMFLVDELEYDDDFYYYSINDLLPNKKLAELWNQHTF